MLLLAPVLAGLVAFIAWRLHALTAGGAVTAFAIGTITLVAGWLPAAAVLFAFFIPAVLLSRLGRARKAALVDVGKHGARDAWQVLANGGVAATCALFALVAIMLSPTELRAASVWWAAFAGAFAAAAADTWGTEIGTLAHAVPRSILTLRTLATGLSGGITLQGTLAEIAGAASVGLVATLTHLAAFLPVVVGGIAGALIDSILGASAQALRWCPRCARACETDAHACGTATTLRRGFGWLGNDAVNLAATLCGALVAGAIALHEPIR